MQKPVRFVLFLALAAGCASTSLEREVDEKGEVNISGDDLEPMVQFVMETRRVLLAEFVRIETTPQFFESSMGFTRDFRYIEKTEWREEDGTRVIQLENISPQKSNLDPDLLPRVYFGQGLEARALNTLRIYFRRPESIDRPLRLEIQGRNNVGNAQLWVSGRLQHDKPTVRILSELIWDENRERYRHRGFTG